jgi:hypothetical protein
MTEQNAQLEGDDIPDEPALRVNLFGEQFAAVDDPGIMASASGHRCLPTLASRLLQSGFDPDRKLILWRGNERVGSTTISIAAQQQQEPLG